MPHNRHKREEEVRNRFEFVVFGNEYSLAHAVLASIDGYVTGGSITWEIVKHDLINLFGDVASSMIQEGLDPTTEIIYIDKFVFQNWEEPAPGLKIALPNKFVPYVAARKRTTEIKPIDDEGVLYGVRDNGDLIFYQDLARNGEAKWHERSQSVIGNGWDKFKFLVSGGDGILYGIRDNGDLIFYQDLARDGKKKWHERSQSVIGKGWNRFKLIASGGNGILYGVTDDGELLFYQDLARDGKRKWHENSRKKIGNGWQYFKMLIGNE